MNEWLVALRPISFLSFLVILGYLAEKTNFVSDINEKLSKLIIHITLPSLVVVSVSSQDVSSIALVEILFIVLVGFIAIFTLMVINYILGKYLLVPIDRLLIHSFLGAFGNVIFLGYPFIYLLFGEIGLFYAIVFSMTNDMILWTYGVYLLKRQAILKNTSLPKSGFTIIHILNPNSISFLIGLAMLFLGLRFPTIIHAPLQSLGETTTPLSMLFIGSILAKLSLSKAVKNISIWSICLVKMVSLPVALIFIIKMILPLLHNINQVLLSVLVLQIAMPTQVILSVLADKYDADPKYAAETVFVTTLFSAVSLPIIYFLCLKIIL